MQKPDCQQYRTNALTVLTTLKEQGFIKAVESQIHWQSNLGLREQAEVIIHARAAHRLDDLKLKMIKHDEVNDAKIALIHYNHAVRNLLWHNPAAIYTDDLKRWLEQSTGDEAWADGIVSGAAGEVAVARALEGLGGVKSIRFASVDEDRHGMDLIVGIYNHRKTEDWLSLDVKARHHLMPGSRFVKLAPAWLDGRRYFQCEMGLESQHVSDSAVLDDRAHRSQLGQLQDYIYAISQRHRISTAI